MPQSPDVASSRLGARSGYVRSRRFTSSTAASLSLNVNVERHRTTIAIRDNSALRLCARCTFVRMLEPSESELYKKPGPLGDRGTRSVKLST